eukprot:3952419-Amphidinium_carterae.1
MKPVKSISCRKVKGRMDFRLFGLALHCILIQQHSLSFGAESVECSVGRARVHGRQNQSNDSMSRTSFTPQLR